MLQIRLNDPNCDPSQIAAMIAHQERTSRPMPQLHIAGASDAIDQSAGVIPAGNTSSGHDPSEAFLRLVEVVRLAEALNEQLGIDTRSGYPDPRAEADYRLAIAQRAEKAQQYRNALQDWVEQQAHGRFDSLSAQEREQRLAEMARQMAQQLPGQMQHQAGDIREEVDRRLSADPLQGAEAVLRHLGMQQREIQAAQERLALARGMMEQQQALANDQATQQRQREFARAENQLRQVVQALLLAEQLRQEQPRTVPQGSPMLTQQAERHNRQIASAQRMPALSDHQRAQLQQIATEAQTPQQFVDHLIAVMGMERTVFPKGPHGEIMTYPLPTAEGTTIDTKVTEILQRARDAAAKLQERVAQVVALAQQEARETARTASPTTSAPDWLFIPDDEQGNEIAQLVERVRQEQQFAERQAALDAERTKANRAAKRAQTEAQRGVQQFQDLRTDARTLGERIAAFADLLGKNAPPTHIKTERGLQTAIGRQVNQAAPFTYTFSEEQRRRMERLAEQIAGMQMNLDDGQDYAAAQQRVIEAITRAVTPYPATAMPQMQRRLNDVATRQFENAAQQQELVLEILNRATALQHQLDPADLADIAYRLQRGQMVNFRQLQGYMNRADAPHLWEQVPQGVDPGMHLLRVAAALQQHLGDRAPQVSRHYPQYLSRQLDTLPIGDAHLGDALREAQAQWYLGQVRDARNMAEAKQLAQQVAGMHLMLAERALRRQIAQAHARYGAMQAVNSGELNPARAMELFGMEGAPIMEVLEGRQVTNYGNGPTPANMRAMVIQAVQQALQQIPMRLRNQDAQDAAIKELGNHAVEQFAQNWRALNHMRLPADMDEIEGVIRQLGQLMLMQPGNWTGAGSDQLEGGIDEDGNPVNIGNHTDRMNPGKRFLDQHTQYLHDLQQAVLDPTHLLQPILNAQGGVTGMQIQGLRPYQDPTVNRADLGDQVPSFDDPMNPLLRADDPRAFGSQMVTQQDGSRMRMLTAPTVAGYNDMRDPATEQWVRLLQTAEAHLIAMGRDNAALQRVPDRQRRLAKVAIAAVMRNLVALDRRGTGMALTLQPEYAQGAIQDLVPPWVEELSQYLLDDQLKTQLGAAQAERDPAKRNALLRAVRNTAFGRVEELLRASYAGGAGRGGLPQHPGVTQDWVERLSQALQREGLDRTQGNRVGAPGAPTQATLRLADLIRDPQFFLNDLTTQGQRRAGYGRFGFLGMLQMLAEGHGGRIQMQRRLPNFAEEQWGDRLSQVALGTRAYNDLALGRQTSRLIGQSYIEHALVPYAGPLAMSMQRFLQGGPDQDQLRQALGVTGRDVGLQDLYRLLGPASMGLMATAHIAGIGNTTEVAKANRELDQFFGTLRNPEGFTPASYMALLQHLAMMGNAAERTNNVQLVDVQKALELMQRPDIAEHAFAQYVTPEDWQQMDPRSQAAAVYHLVKAGGSRYILPGESQVPVTALPPMWRLLHRLAQDHLLPGMRTFEETTGMQDAGGAGLSAPTMMSKVRQQAFAIKQQLPQAIQRILDWGRDRNLPDDARRRIQQWNFQPQDMALVNEQGRVILGRHMLLPQQAYQTMEPDAAWREKYEAYREKLIEKYFGGRAELTTQQEGVAEQLALMLMLEGEGANGGQLSMPRADLQELVKQVLRPASGTIQEDDVVFNAQRIPTTDEQLADLDRAIRDDQYRAFGVGAAELRQARQAGETTLRGQPPISQIAQSAVPGLLDELQVPSPSGGGGLAETRRIGGQPINLRDLTLYTGIGSRETPSDILALMQDLGQILGGNGALLRSGHARGADQAFEAGAERAQAPYESYLPFARFEQSTAIQSGSALPLTEEQLQMIEASPHYATLIQAVGYDPRTRTDFVRRAMARNLLQILGPDLQTPTQGVIAYTRNAQMVGGTRAALGIAKQLGIPIWNLGDRDTRQQIEAFIASGPNQGALSAPELAKLQAQSSLTQVVPEAQQTPPPAQQTALPMGSRAPPTEQHTPEWRVFTEHLRTYRQRAGQLGEQLQQAERTYQQAFQAGNLIVAAQALVRKHAIIQQFQQLHGAFNQLKQGAEQFNLPMFGEGSAFDPHIAQAQHQQRLEEQFAKLQQLAEHVGEDSVTYLHYQRNRKYQAVTPLQTHVNWPYQQRQLQGYAAYLTKHQHPLADRIAGLFPVQQLISDEAWKQAIQHRDDTPRDLVSSHRREIDRSLRANYPYPIEQDEALHQAFAQIQSANPQQQLQGYQRLVLFYQDILGNVQDGTHRNHYTFLLKNARKHIARLQRQIGAGDTIMGMNLPGFLHGMLPSPEEPGLLNRAWDALKRLIAPGLLMANIEGDGQAPRHLRRPRMASDAARMHLDLLQSPHTTSTHKALDTIASPEQQEWIQRELTMRRLSRLIPAYEQLRDWYGQLAAGDTPEATYFQLLQQHAQEQIVALQPKPNPKGRHKLIKRQFIDERSRGNIARSDLTAPHLELLTSDDEAQYRQALAAFVPEEGLQMVQQALQGGNEQELHQAMQILARWYRAAEKKNPDDADYWDLMHTWANEAAQQIDQGNDAIIGMNIPRALQRFLPPVDQPGLLNRAWAHFARGRGANFDQAVERIAQRSGTYHRKIAAQTANTLWRQVSTATGYHPLQLFQAQRHATLAVLRERMGQHHVPLAAHLQILGLALDSALYHDEHAEGEKVTEQCMNCGKITGTDRQLPYHVANWSNSICPDCQARIQQQLQERVSGQYSPQTQAFIAHQDATNALRRARPDREAIPHIDPYAPTAMMGIGRFPSRAGMLRRRLGQGMRGLARRIAPYLPLLMMPEGNEGFLRDQQRAQQSSDWLRDGDAPVPEGHGAPWMFREDQDDSSEWLNDNVLQGMHAAKDALMHVYDPNNMAYSGQDGAERFAQDQARALQDYRLAAQALGPEGVDHFLAGEQGLQALLSMQGIDPYTGAVDARGAEQGAHQLVAQWQEALSHYNDVPFASVQESAAPLDQHAIDAYTAQAVAAQQHPATREAWAQAQAQAQQAAQDRQAAASARIMEQMAALRQSAPDASLHQTPGAADYVSPIAQDVTSEPHRSFANSGTLRLSGGSTTHDRAFARQTLRTQRQIVDQAHRAWQQGTGSADAFLNAYSALVDQMRQTGLSGPALRGTGLTQRDLQHYRHDDAYIRGRRARGESDAAPTARAATNLPPPTPLSSLTGSSSLPSTPSLVASTPPILPPPPSPPSAPSGSAFFGAPIPPQGGTVGQSDLFDLAIANLARDAGAQAQLREILEDRHGTLRYAHLAIKAPPGTGKTQFLSSLATGLLVHPQNRLQILVPTVNAKRVLEERLNAMTGAIANLHPQAYQPQGRYSVQTFAALGRHIMTGGANPVIARDLLHQLSAALGLGVSYDAQAAAPPTLLDPESDAIQQFLANTVLPAGHYPRQLTAEQLDQIVKDIGNAFNNGPNALARIQQGAARFAQNPHPLTDAEVVHRDAHGISPALFALFAQQLIAHGATTFDFEQFLLRQGLDSQHPQIQAMMQAILPQASHVMLDEAQAGTENQLALAEGMARALHAPLTLAGDENQQYDASLTGRDFIGDLTAYLAGRVGININNMQGIKEVALHLQSRMSPAQTAVVNAIPVPVPPGTPSIIDETPSGMIHLGERPLWQMQASEWPQVHEGITTYDAMQTQLLQVLQAQGLGLEEAQTLAGDMDELVQRGDPETANRILSLTAKHDQERLFRAIARLYGVDELFADPRSRPDVSTAGGAEALTEWMRKVQRTRIAAAGGVQAEQYVNLGAYDLPFRVNKDKRAQEASAVTQMYVGASRPSAQGTLAFSIARQRLSAHDMGDLQRSGDEVQAGNRYAYDTATNTYIPLGAIRGISEFDGGKAVHPVDMVMARAFLSRMALWALVEASGASNMGAGHLDAMLDQAPPRILRTLHDIAPEHLRQLANEAYQHAFQDYLTLRAHPDAGPLRANFGINPQVPTPFHSPIWSAAYRAVQNFITADTPEVKQGRRLFGQWVGQARNRQLPIPADAREALRQRLHAAFNVPMAQNQMRGAHEANQLLDALPVDQIGDLIQALVTPGSDLAAFGAQGGLTSDETDRAMGFLQAVPQGALLGPPTPAQQAQAARNRRGSVSAPHGGGSPRARGNPRQPIMPFPSNWNSQEWEQYELDVKNFAAAARQAGLTYTPKRDRDKRTNAQLRRDLALLHLKYQQQGHLSQSEAEEAMYIQRILGERSAMRDPLPADLQLPEIHQPHQALAADAFFNNQNVQTLMGVSGHTRPPRAARPTPPPPPAPPSSSQHPGIAPVHAATILASNRMMGGDEFLHFLEAQYGAQAHDIARGLAAQVGAHLGGDPTQMQQMAAQMGEADLLDFFDHAPHMRALESMLSGAAGPAAASISGAIGPGVPSRSGVQSLPPLMGTESLVVPATGPGSPGYISPLGSVPSQEHVSALPQSAAIPSVSSALNAPASARSIPYEQEHLVPLAGISDPLEAEIRGYARAQLLHQGLSQSEAAHRAAAMSESELKEFIQNGPRPFIGPKPYFRYNSQNELTLNSAFVQEHKQRQRGGQPVAPPPPAPTPLPPPTGPIRTAGAVGQPPPQGAQGSPPHHVPPAQTAPPSPLGTAGGDAYDAFVATQMQGNQALADQMILGLQGGQNPANASPRAWYNAFVHARQQGALTMQDAADQANAQLLAGGAGMGGAPPRRPTGQGGPPPNQPPPPPPGNTAGSASYPNGPGSPSQPLNGTAIWPGQGGGAGGGPGGNAQQQANGFVNNLVQAVNQAFGNVNISSFAWGMQQFARTTARGIFELSFASSAMAQELPTQIQANQQFHLAAALAALYGSGMSDQKNGLYAKVSGSVLAQQAAQAMPGVSLTQLLTDYALQSAYTGSTPTMGSLITLEGASKLTGLPQQQVLQLATQAAVAGRAYSGATFGQDTQNTIMQALRAGGPIGYGDMLTAAAMIPYGSTANNLSFLQVGSQAFGGSPSSYQSLAQLSGALQQTINNPTTEQESALAAIYQPGLVSQGKGIQALQALEREFPGVATPGSLQQQADYLNRKVNMEQLGMQLTLHLSQLQINADTAQIAVMATQQQILGEQIQQAQMDLSFQKYIDTAEYGPIGKDVSKQAYYDFERSQAMAGRNQLDGEHAVDIGSYQTFGLQNAEFFAGIEHQRTEALYQRSPLLGDLAFKEQMHYLDQQEKFYEAELKLRNEERAYNYAKEARQIQWQEQMYAAEGAQIAAQTAILEANKKILALQDGWSRAELQALGDQQRAQDLALTGQYGLDPSMSPLAIVQQLAKVLGQNNDKTAEAIKRALQDEFGPQIGNTLIAFAEWLQKNPKDVGMTPQQLIAAISQDKSANIDQNTLKQLLQGNASSMDQYLAGQTNADLATWNTSLAGLVQNTVAVEMAFGKLAGTMAPLNAGLGGASLIFDKLAPIIMTLAGIATLLSEMFQAMALSGAGAGMGAAAMGIGGAALGAIPYIVAAVVAYFAVRGINDLLGNPIGKFAGWVGNDVKAGASWAQQNILSPAEQRLEAFATWLGQTPLIKNLHGFADNLGALFGEFGNWVSHTPLAKEAFKQIGQLFQDLGTLADFATKVLGASGNTLGPLLGGFFDLIGTIAHGMMNGTGKMLSGIGDFISFIIDLVTFNWGHLGKDLGKSKDEMAGGITDWYNGFVKGVQNMLHDWSKIDLKSIWAPVTKDLVAFIQKLVELWNDLKNTVIARWNDVKNAVMKAYQAVVDFFHRVGDWIHQNITPEKIGYAIGYMMGRLIRFLIDLPQEIGDVKKWGLQLSVNLVEQLYKWAQQVIKIAGDILGDIGHVKDLIWGAMVRAWNATIGAFWNALWGFAKQVGEDIIAQSQKEAKLFMQHPDQFFKQLGDGIMMIIQFWGNVFASIGTFLGNAKTMILQAISEFLIGLLKGFAAGLGFDPHQFYTVVTTAIATFWNMVIVDPLMRFEKTMINLVSPSDWVKQSILNPLGRLRDKLIEAILTLIDPQKLFNDLVAAFIWLASSFTKPFAQFDGNKTVGLILKPILAIAPDILNGFNRLWNKGTQFFTAFFKPFNQMPLDVAQDFLNFWNPQVFVKSFVKTVEDAFAGITQALKNLNLLNVAQMIANGLKTMAVGFLEALINVFGNIPVIGGDIKKWLQGYVNQLTGNSMTGTQEGAAASARPPAPHVTHAGTIHLPGGGALHGTPVTTASQQTINLVIEVKHDGTVTQTGTIAIDPKDQDTIMTQVINTMTQALTPLIVSAPVTP